jgi:hypothetical protein
MASTAHPVDASRYVAYFFYGQILVYYVSSQSSNYESPSRTPWGVAFQTTWSMLWGLQHSMWLAIFFFLDNDTN